MEAFMRANNLTVAFVLWFCLGVANVTCLAQAMQTIASPEQNRESEKIWNDAKRTDPKGWASSVLQAQEDLARFGYGTVFTAELDDKTKEALRAYQSRNKLPPTGELDFATWRQMEQDSTALMPDIPLGPIFLFNDSAWDNIVTVEGIWLEQGKAPTAITPYRSTRIECFKTTRTCVAATRGDTLTHIQYLDVERWDQYEIVTRPDDLPCGREYIQITRAQQTILAVNTAVYKNKDACTKLFGPPGEPVISRLEDAGQLREARLKVFRLASQRILVLSSEARTRTGMQEHREASICATRDNLCDACELL
jgi:hypothetical protein